MAVKVLEAVGSPTRTVSSLDLGLDANIPDAIASKIKQDVGQYIVEQVLLTLSEAKSPVKGESWPKLSEKYKKIKVDAGGSPIANMELYGDMLDSLSFEETDAGVDVGFLGEQAWKADGHLKFSGAENNTPQRRFLPGDGEEFRSNIQDGIDKIIADGMSEQFDKSDFENVDTKTELYDTLAEIFGEEMSRTDMKLAVLRNEYLYDMLDELDILDLL